MARNQFRFAATRSSNGALISVVVVLLLAISLTVTMLGLPVLREVVAGQTAAKRIS